jgi:hypothetical protein
MSLCFDEDVIVVNMYCVRHCVSVNSVSICLRYSLNL